MVRRAAASIRCLPAPRCVEATRKPWTLTGATAGRSSRRSRSGGLHVDLVHEAPDPVLPRLQRADDRVAGRLRVGRGVLVRRIVAAPDATAGQALSKVDPPGADAQALLAPRGDPLHGSDHV